MHDFRSSMLTWFSLSIIKTAPSSDSLRSTEITVTKPNQRTKPATDYVQIAENAGGDIIGRLFLASVQAIVQL